jgi:hypothetical protein
MFGIGKDHWAQSRQLFEDQFESSGENYLYRHSMKGAPIHVTAEERQRFIDDYARRLRYSSRITIIGLLIVVSAAVWWVMATSAEFPDTAVYIGLGAVAAFCVGYTLWAGGAPARELQRRPVLGGERSRAEMRKLALSRIGYGQLAATAFAGLLLPFGVFGRHDVLAGWGRLWLVMGVLMVALAGVQAFRKWNFERDQH